MKYENVASLVRGSEAFIEIMDVVNDEVGSRDVGVVDDGGDGGVQVHVEGVDAGFLADFGGYCVNTRIASHTFYNKVTYC